MLVSTIAEILELSFRRIQFTPDLMPSDITGTDVLQDDPDTHQRAFHFLQGPLFANIVLADEINRTPPKTQAALLEAMQERRVTVGTNTYPLPSPFFVLATQNPIEQEGTYPLPEAQLDRFLVQIDVNYPDRATEKAIILATTGVEDGEVRQVFTAQELLDAQTLLRRMPVGEAVVDMILDLVRACRPEDELSTLQVRENVSWGPGPRAAQALMMTVRAAALLDGRLAPTPDDVIDMARPVLMHRMALSFAAKARGETLGDLIDSVVAQVGKSEAAA
jgi:MoxR-like ATPase